MSIERSTTGLMDYCMSKVEEIDERTDIDIDKKVKYGLSYIREIRGLAGLELQHKKLVRQAPEIAKNRAIVLPIGSAPKVLANEEQKSAAG